MKKKWKKIMAAWCAATMLMTMPGTSALADELADKAIITVAEDPYSTVDVVDSLDEGDTDVEVPAEEVPDEEDVPVEAEPVEQKTPEEIVGVTTVTVGDGVTATFNANTGAVEFYSNGGTLWSDWADKIGIKSADRYKITSITVKSGTVYLPADSRGYDSKDYKMFGGLSGLQSLDLRKFNTSKVTDMSHMFRYCKYLKSLELSAFDTSKVLNMGFMFEDCESLTSLDLSSFDTSKVTDMSWMFVCCFSLTGLDLSGFSTSNVKDMSGMFSRCQSLTSLDLSSFDTSNVTNMEHMFDSSYNLTSLNLSSFDTSRVTSMRAMFNYLINMTSFDLSNFDTSKVTNMRSMFADCQSPTSLNLNSFDTSNVTDMVSMFYGCQSLTSLNLNNFDTSNVTDMESMFYGCQSLTSLNLSSWDTPCVTNMEDMFVGCRELKNLDLSNFDTSRVTNMQGMFRGCRELKNLDLSNFDTSNVTSMIRMFNFCSGFTSLDLSNFNTSNVTSMASMFRDCSSLTNLNLSGFDTSNVENMDYMFSNCSSFTSLDLSNFNTSNVTSMVSMFLGCSSFTSLNLSNFNTSKLKYMEYMFKDCNNLTNLDLSSFDTSNVSEHRVNDGEWDDIYPAMCEAFYGCDNLQILKTPKKHILSGIVLPYTMYDSDGLSYTELPVLSNSIILTKTKDLVYYTVTYDANGGTGTPSSQEKQKNVALTLSSAKPSKQYMIRYNSNGGSVSPASKSISCTFNNWNTAKNGTGTSYAPGGSYTANADATLYAQWSNPKAGTLATPTRSGYVFTGWFTSATGGNQISSSSVVSGNITIYARWTDPYNLGDETYSFSNYSDSDSWGGHCFGMSVTSSGYENKLLDIKRIGGNENTPLYSFRNTQIVRQPICYYQAIQGSYANRAIVAGGSVYLSGRHNITSDWPAVVNFVKDHKYDGTGLLQIGFRKENQGGHAINFLYYQNVNGQDRIYAYDNNFPDREVYFYQNAYGNIVEAPVQTFNGAIDCMALRDVRIYFNSVGDFDSRYVVYMAKDAAEVEGYTYSFVEDGSADGDYVMYEIPADRKKITINPKKDNADFIYMGTEYSFGKITDETRGELTFSTLDETSGSSNERFVIYEGKPAAYRFSDVQDPNHAYYKAIYWAAEKGITKGYSDGTFGINRSCTRGEMMMFLWRYAGKPAPKNVSKSPFKDVPKTHTFYKAILWGSQKGITKGYSDGTFGINRNVSRGECMMFLWRLKGKPAPKAVAKAPFPDVPKSHVFYNAVLWGYQKKITTGFTSGKLKGKFGVNENCSRGQIVTFLYRAK